MRHAFSLVELSIVLVILGLLTGGVLAGQSLIHAAELRAVTTEYTRYATAAQTFKEKYFAMPGDMSNATAFWGAMSNCKAAAPYVGSGTQTCNGNGDGGIGFGDNANTWANEGTLFWQHLANAGLIEGSYTGVTSDTSYWNSPSYTFGVNAPKSKFPNAGWTAFTTVTQPTCCGPIVHSYDVSSTILIEGNYGNVFLFGTSVNLNGGGPVMSPQDAWNIDNKMDDGKAGTGNIVVPEYATSCYLLADGTAGSTSSTVARIDVQYKLTSTSKDCALFFRNAF